MWFHQNCLHYFLCDLRCGGPSCNSFECLNVKKLGSLFLSFVVVVFVPPKLLLSLLCSRILFHAMFWIVCIFISWYLGKDCSGVSSRSHWCILFHVAPSLCSPLQCILFHAAASVSSWRLIASMHFVSCSARFLLFRIDEFYFMRRMALSICIDAFCFMQRNLLCFMFNWSPRGTHPAKA